MKPTLPGWFIVLAFSVCPAKTLKVNCCLTTGPIALIFFYSDRLGKLGGRLEAVFLNFKFSFEL